MEMRSQLSSGVRWLHASRILHVRPLSLPTLMLNHMPLSFVERSRSGAMTFATATLLLAANPHCGGPHEVVVQQYDLLPCPESTFVLPRSASSASYTVSARPNRSPTSGMRCPALEYYQLRERSRRSGEVNFEVGLTRGPRCTLSLVYGYNTAGTSAETMRRYAQTVAELVLQGSSSRPDSAAVMSERFDSDQKVADRCPR